MRLTTTSILLLPLALATSNATPMPLSLQMAHSIMTRHEGIYSSSADSSGPLQAGIVQKTFSQLLAQYPKHTLTPSLSAYILSSADSLLPIFSNASSALKFSLDRVSTGNAFLRLSTSNTTTTTTTTNITTSQKTEYARAAEALQSSLDLNLRNDQGGLQYYVYPHWSYLDGMFSFPPFAALHATLSACPCNATAWADIQLQFQLLAQHCAYSGEFNGTGIGKGEGLLVHGYDSSRTAVWARNELGQSPHVWGRSLGWYVLGLLETISVIDDDEGVAEGCGEAAGVRSWLLNEFRTRMDAVVSAVDVASGAWPLLLDQSPQREGNYVESSGSAMFVWALLGGVRRGYLAPSASYPANDSSDAPYIDVATRAYNYLKDTYVVDLENGTLGWNGTVSVCSLNSTASYEYYTGRPLLWNSVLGSAAFVGASAEVEMLELAG